MPSVNPNQSDKETEPFVEVDPTRRYGRYTELLGCGAVKKVYRAFDQEEGIEVAWNQVKLRNFSDDPSMIDRLYSEVRLLRSLTNSNIISLYNVWRDEEHNTLNFITEVCTSGNLREYRKKHRQILIAAMFLLMETLVKIGDLGLAAIVGKNHSAHSILGTPEFMAPELYDEHYTELVDIYSFGMCVLEMVTLEFPYRECDNVAKIYKKVSSGVRPQALNKFKDEDAKAFIERCIAQPGARPSAAELLKDPFFDEVDDDDENDQ
ncbi:putative serine/threonine-protein kinase WNK2 [Hibiscus syriacus]|uniref:non-specific serine/threonine protein kinase n=1 Tax=Hibiscus syriacus TaxID=106335 RepID=A0A6A2XBZ0_HIBSY|nr:putative serine/threonine-protein kinase WNK2 [Hibiscus syriacus]